MLYLNNLDRLEVRYNIDEISREQKIPRFLLQPLVENSIKHGIAKVIGPGEIEIEVSCISDSICIRIYDSGPPFQASNSQSGYGIKGSLDKLELLYQDRYTFELKNDKRKCVEIQIKN